MVQKKTILVVDDHPVFREGLKAVIECDGRFELIGEAENAYKGLQMVRELEPDLALVDISLPDESGIELTRKIKGLLSATQILIVSVHAKIDYITEAFQAGATGYILKESGVERLLQGIEHVSKGNSFLDSALSSEVVKELVQSPVRKAKITDARYETLTPREQEVMRLIAEGFSTRKVARKLFISPRTADNHRSNIMRKLGLHSKHELIRFSAKLGLIDINLWKE
jgi:DNA-binding NarL/FixJ family response regulator